MQNFCKYKISNKVIIPVLIVLAFAFALAIFALDKFGAKGDVVSISKDGKVIKQIYYSDLQSPVTIDLGGNVVVVDHNGAVMKSASCPDKLCVHQGKITNSACPIVCLPNKVTVSITDGGGDIDAVSGK